MYICLMTFEMVFPREHLSAQTALKWFQLEMDSVYVRPEVFTLDLFTTDRAGV